MSAPLAILIFWLLAMATVLVWIGILVKRLRFRRIWLIYGGLTQNHVLGLFSTKAKADETFYWYTELTGAEGCYLIDEIEVDVPIPPKETWPAIRMKAQAVEKSDG